MSRLGKCFHPPCARHITLGRENGSYRYSLAHALEGLYHDCHKALLDLAEGQTNAYSYLYHERNIHPSVISGAMIGAVPASYDVMLHIQPVLDEAHKALAALQCKSRGRSTRQLEYAEKRLEDLQDAQQKLVTCLAHHAGWLVFFYTDQSHHIVALRLRQPYTKQFVSFKANIAGLFGRELFTPFQHTVHQDLNQFLLIVEGEFNQLQLQSLIVRYEETTGQTLGYVNVCAAGSVTSVDTSTIQRVAQHPVVCYDNDQNGAGFALVQSLQHAMRLEACTTPTDDSDLDSFICSFGQESVAAWEAVQALIAARQPYERLYSGTGEEFFRYTGKRREFIPRWLASAAMERQHYHYVTNQLWVYRDGVYLPCGDATLSADCQDLLGDERREARLSETMHYVHVATRLEGDPAPDPQYINLANGRLEWQTRDLHPHTPAQFTVVQLPFAYDEQALCPTFDRYLQTTFDDDMAPLVEELLGWALVPDNRYEKAVMLTGAGDNGKSVFLDMVGYLLGEHNISNVALQDLEENRFRAAELYGKLANISADLDARGLRSSSMFKMLTTGDWVTAERKRQDPFKFRSVAKLIFSANKIPPSRDRTYAFYKRWIIVPFTHTFNGQDSNPSPNTTLREKLQGELPGIFLRALAGLDRLTANGAFTEPPSVRDAMNAYIRSNESVRVFVKECVVLDASGSIEKQEFYDVYTNWCASYGERAVSQRALHEDLYKVVPQLNEWRQDRYAKWAWVGMSWSAEADAYFPPKLNV